MKNGLVCLTIIVTALNLLAGCREASSPKHPTNTNADEVQRELRALREEVAKSRSQAQRHQPVQKETPSEIQQSLQQWSLSDERPSSQAPSAPPSSYQRAEAPPAKNDSEQMLQFLILQGFAEQQRRQQARNDQQYQKFQRAAEQARTCQACGGSGSYRYVDASGQLRLQTCTYCQGLGRNW